MIGYPGVVIFESLYQIFGEAGVDSRGRSLAAKQIIVEHGCGDVRGGVPFLAGRGNMSPSFAVPAMEGIPHLPAVVEKWRKGWESIQNPMDA